MKKETFQKWFENYHGGSFVSIVKEKHFGDYLKRTQVVARFCAYGETQESEKHEASNKQNNFVYLIKNALKYNTKTKNTLLVVQKIPHHKKHYFYFYKGVEIPKEVFYANVKDRGENQSNYSNYKLEEVVSVGGIR